MPSTKNLEPNCALMKFSCCLFFNLVSVRMRQSRDAVYIRSCIKGTLVAHTVPCVLIVVSAMFNVATAKPCWWQYALGMGVTVCGCNCGHVTECGCRCGQGVGGK